MEEALTLEIFIEGSWRSAGVLEIYTRRYTGRATFSYEIEYIDGLLGQLESIGAPAASVRYPLNYLTYEEKRWPSIMLDIIPTGAARANWIQRLRLTDDADADLELLKAAINPPGNIRIQPPGGVDQELNKHPGFEYEEVVQRGVDFASYAEKMGAIVSGTSGAQGEAPKFLLVQDPHGQWHGDGAVDDAHVGESWLVKFPRSKSQLDKEILKMEQVYYEIASELKVKTHGPLKWDRDTLFIPRFDREKLSGNKLQRHGLESLISAMGIAEFGVKRTIEEYLEVINKYSSLPQEDILEFVYRDFLNIVMGNTDNHGRNSAFLKNGDQIRLAPLFDFAPMVLDESLIPRVSQWKDEKFHIPDFRSIYNTLIHFGIDHDRCFDFLRGAKERIENLPDILAKKNVDASLVSRATRKYDEFMKHLSQYLIQL